MKQTFEVSANKYHWLIAPIYGDKPHCSYRKRKIRIVISDLPLLPYNTFWDGGSKNTYRAIQLASGKVASLLTGDSPWNAIAEGKAITLEPGIAVIEDTIFCGKEMMATVYLHPDNAVKILPSSNQ